MAGTLFLVATPIGNLDDLSPRAQRVLLEADLVACEDTRRTGLLLARLPGTRPPLVSYHEHNERSRVGPLVERLVAGASIALVSDAGTPLLSDPGFPLVRAAIAAGVRVEAIPGANAALLALQLSGLPPLPFTVLGFAPPKSGKRRTFWAEAERLGHTIVAYESPHRILVSLADAVAVLGPRPAAIARELTKLHEEVLRGSLDELHAEVLRRGGLKGELVVVVDGAAAVEKPTAEESSTQGQPKPSRRRTRR
jgi:16S rRNA (cytidine1402-2'-O)-methyltransferase